MQSSGLLELKAILHTLSSHPPYVRIQEHVSEMGVTALLSTHTKFPSVSVHKWACVCGMEMNENARRENLFAVYLYFLFKILEQLSLPLSRLVQPGNTAPVAFVLIQLLYTIFYGQQQQLIIMANNH